MEWVLGAVASYFIGVLGSTMAVWKRSTLSVQEALILALFWPLIGLFACWDALMWVRRRFTRV